jgi:hypothetical protein
VVQHRTVRIADRTFDDMWLIRDRVRHRTPAFLCEYA